MAAPADEPDESADRRRRRILGSLGLLGLLGIGGVAGYRRITDRPAPSDALVSAIPDEELQALASRYAPDLHFDRRERWFPTNTLEYSLDPEEEHPVVGGFHALREYTSDYRERGHPPAATVYWHAHDATADVFAIQYWMYSVFDQFTVNFHWHDWELLQVFIDAETREPILVSASAHSRSSPNNEYVEPDLGDERRPTILAELGSHSSATDLNDQIPSFERLPDERGQSDVTNDWVGVTDRIDTPFAYGLPRDEGAHLPMVLPELDEDPLHEHPRLSDVVRREDFLDEAVTVRGWRDLARPPTELPIREPGLVMTHPESATSGDVTYDLREMREVDHIDRFTGPQLSFEFPIPQFVEDAYADHITDVGIPWEQPRYTDPLSDVTDIQHRFAVQGIEATDLLDRVVGQFTILGSGADGEVDGMTAEELDDHGELVDVSRQPLPVELAVRLASPSPNTVATNDGVFGFLRVDGGEHLLGAIGPGLAPVAIRFEFDGGTVQLGAEGRLTVVANADAAWIRGDGRDQSGIAHVRVVEDFAGPVYEGESVEKDRFAVAVHRDGRYIVEVIDREGVAGAVRVIPGERDEVTLEDVATGKLSLLRVLADYLASTVELAYDLCEACDLLSTYVGPRRAAFDTAEELRAATHRDVVALEDRVAVRLETAGMPDVTPETALESMAVEFRLIEGEGEPEVFDATDPGIAFLAGETGVYVTLDMADSEVRFARGQTWEVDVSVPGVETIAPTTVAIVERRVELAMDEPPYRVTASEDAIIGSSTMAPGTDLTVRVRMGGEFIRSREIAIDDSGLFEARFDFSDRQVGEEFEIEIVEGDRVYVSEAGVIADEPAERSVDPISEGAMDAGWEVIQLIAEAATVTNGLVSRADSINEAEMNDGLDDVQVLLVQATDRVRSEDAERFGRTGGDVLVRRLEAVLERSEEAMETRV